MNILVNDTNLTCPYCQSIFKDKAEMSKHIDRIHVGRGLEGDNGKSSLFLLRTRGQRLIELNHPDNTLITYPDLGHHFYPSSQWTTESGPIPEYVLADLYA